MNKGTLGNDPTKYKEVFSIEGVLRLYAPVNGTDYHISRIQEAMRINAYSSAGIEVGMLEKHYDYVLQLANEDSPKFKSEVIGVIHSLKARMKHPVDAHCGMRMGIALTFMEYEEGGIVVSEEPGRVEYFWNDKKEGFAMMYPDLYAFFLTMGILHTEMYTKHLSILDDLDYFREREMRVRSLMSEEAYRELYKR